MGLFPKSSQTHEPIAETILELSLQGFGEEEMNHRDTWLLRTARVSGWPLLIAVGTGCASMQPRTDPMQEAQQPRAVVEWVFNVPDALVLNWGLFPAIKPGWVTAAGVTNNRVLLLCDLGGASENTRPSRAYELDLNSGSVIKSMTGPAHTYWNSWIVTPGRLYFRAGSHEGWWAFDLDRGVIDRRPASPDPKDILDKRDGPYDGDPGAQLSGAYFDSERLSVYLWDLGLDRKLYVKRESRPGGSIKFVLGWIDARGATHNQDLCRFPVRPDELSEQLLLVNDDGRLLFTWGQHVICVDTRGLQQAPASQTQPSSSCNGDHPDHPLVFPSHAERCEQTVEPHEMDNPIERVSRIRLGDPLERVTSIMGQPTYDDVMMRKERQDIIGRRLIYVFSRKDPDLLNDNTDAYVCFIFDTNDRLIDSDAHNLSGLKE